MLSLLALLAQKYLQKHKYWLILKPAHAAGRAVCAAAAAACNAAGRMTTQFACFTITKVRILTQKGVAGRASGAAAAAAARKRRWAHAVVEVLR